MHLLEKNVGFSSVIYVRVNTSYRSMSKQQNDSDWLSSSFGSYDSIQIHFLVSLLVHKLSLLYFWYTRLYMYLIYFVNWCKHINEMMVKYILLTQIIIPDYKDIDHLIKSSVYS